MTEPSDKTKREMARGRWMAFRNGQEDTRAARHASWWDAWRERDRYMEQQMAAGLISIQPESYEGRSHVVASVGGTCTFTDTLEEYPSERMVANVALAIQAGMAVPHISYPWKEWITNDG